MTEPIRTWTLEAWSSGEDFEWAVAVCDQRPIPAHCEEVIAVELAPVLDLLEDLFDGTRGVPPTPSALDAAEAFLRSHGRLGA